MQTNKAIQRFEDAVREHEMIGSKRPEEQRDINNEYLAAREALRAELQKQRSRKVAA